MSLPAAEEVAVESVRFNAGALTLEGELAYGEACPRRAVVLAGSHPFLGGNMHNNVVRGVGDGLAERRSVTLRFNYRGIGGSQGPRIDLAQHLADFWATSHAPDEMDLREDVQAAVNYLRQSVAAALPLTLVGYSFGCALLPLVQGEFASYVLIAPPLGKHDYEPYRSLGAPILVIASENDFTLEAERLRSWFDSLRAPKRLVQEARDNHFFRGHEPWLVETVLAFLEDHGG